MTVWMVVLQASIPALFIHTATAQPLDPAWGHEVAGLRLTSKRPFQLEA
jgi:hypothetical protein